MIHIPQNFIHDLVNRIDIVDVVAARVPLKKTGNNHTACCPFHNEKTASFTVSSEKQFYHCFGCGAHGNAIGFVMEYDRLEFTDAVTSLANSIGLAIPTNSNPVRRNQTKPKQTEDLYQLTQQAQQYYQQQLRQSATAVAYLKQRGIDGATAKTFGLGYAPAGWDNLLKRFNSPKALLNTGMIIQKESGGYYDRFRDRIMFPIHDRRGRVIGFGGRTLGDATPKYLNSPETPLFQKGRELYGLWQARQQHRTLERILVVEGYMDVILLAQHGISYAVATLGTAVTPEHLRILLHSAPEIIFCFDGDQAGQTAAWRALETSLPLLQDRHNLKFLLLPTDEDPDSQVRKEGKAAFEQRLQHALPLSDYIIQHMQQNFALDSLQGRAQAAEFVRPLLQKLAAELLQQLLTDKIAAMLGISNSKLIGRSRPNTQARENSGSKHSLKINDLRLAIAILLQQPKLASKLPDLSSLQTLDNPGIALLFDLLARIQAKPDSHAGSLLEYYRDSQYAATINKLSNYAIVQTSDDKMLRELLQDACQQLLRKAHEQRYLTLLQKPRDSLTAAERQELQEFGAKKV